MAHRVVFLDRDGTINVDSGFVYEIKNWQFTEGAPEALKLLQDAGFLLTVITNQGAIGEGVYTEADMHTLHEFMESELAGQGIKFAAIEFCPHAIKVQCDCRKPEIGMAKRIEQKIGPIDYAASWTIGDKPKDVGFGTKLGTRTAIIRTHYWNDANLGNLRPNLIVNSLAEAAERIVHDDK